MKLSKMENYSVSWNGRHLIYALVALSLASGQGIIAYALYFVVLILVSYQFNGLFQTKVLLEERVKDLEQKIAQLTPPPEDPVDKTARMLKKEPDFEVLQNRLGVAWDNALNQCIIDNGWTIDEYRTEDNRLRDIRMAKYASTRSKPKKWYQFWK